MFDEPEIISGERFGEMIQHLQENEGLSMETQLSDYQIRCFNFGPERMAIWNADEQLLHVVFPANRKVLLDFPGRLENGWFPPGTPFNDELRLSYYRWQELLWIIVSVPLHRIDWCREAAKLTGARLADGVPHVVGSDLGKAMGNARINLIPGVTAVRFPLNSPRTFTLEPEHHSKGPVIGAMGLMPPVPPPLPKTYVDDIIEQMQLKRGAGKTRKH